MTEGDWLSATDPEPMLMFLQAKLSDRKNRLFACACWRATVAERQRQGDEFNYIELKDAIVAAEQWADSGKAPALPARDFGHIVLLKNSQEAARQTLGGRVNPAALPPRTLARLLRHVGGNPFLPYPAPSSWPSPIVALAEALYADDASSHDPLHDALLEAGHPDLAAHFREEDDCPKGCWVLDILTGRK